MTPEPWTVLTYPMAHWPFTRFAAQSLKVNDLSRLTGTGPRWTWQTDQSSSFHQRLYAGFDAWRAAYDRFVRVVIAPHLDEPFYYQAVPTFRVHLPGNVAVGELHTDATYDHPPGEETFWVPLTSAFDTCSVWITDDDGVLRAPDVHPGDVVRFSAVTRVHGNKVNDTERSRVSFDFRCLPARLLPAVNDAVTWHTKMRFVPGEYYAAAVITP